MQKTVNDSEKFKIIIAEDEESNFLFLSYLLKKLNLDVIHTITGTETVDACRNHPDIKLILMDIKLPEMSGFEATRKIREFNKDVYIIAQTAFSGPDSDKKAIKAGCDDYIAKPINGEYLINKITDLVNS